MTAMAEAAGVFLAVHESFQFQAPSPHPPVTRTFKALLPTSYYEFDNGQQTESPDVSKT